MERDMERKRERVAGWEDEEATGHTLKPFCNLNDGRKAPAGRI